MGKYLYLITLEYLELLLVLMDIAVKNTVLAKTYISKFAYNPIKNILACNIDGNDTIQFFFVENNLSFS